MRYKTGRQEDTYPTESTGREGRGVRQEAEGGRKNKSQGGKRDPTRVSISYI